MLPELNRYGEVYTTRIQQKNFSGKGVFDPEYVKTKADPDGKVIVDGVRSTVVTGNDVVDPAYVVDTPNTLRFKFEDASYDPVAAGIGASGTWTKREDFTYDGNIWDWTRTNADWTSVFNGALVAGTNDCDVIAGNTGTAYSMASAFRVDTGLRSIKLNIPGTNNMFSCFLGCSNLEEASLTITTNSTTNGNNLFYQCAKLRKVYISSWRKFNILNAAFSGCFLLEELPEIDDVSSITQVDNMFRACYSVGGGTLSLYERLSRNGKITTHVSTFTNCGRDTAAAEELKYIPVSWGGTGEYVVEIGNKSYRKVHIGSQVWLDENLSYVWDGLTVGAGDSSAARASYYDSDETTWGYYGRRCGMLYNGTAAQAIVDDSTHQIIPAGYHLPTYDDIMVLTRYLGGESTEYPGEPDWANFEFGEKLRKGLLQWAPIWSGNNSSGFSFLPSGMGVMSSGNLVFRGGGGTGDDSGSIWLDELTNDGTKRTIFFTAMADGGAGVASQSLSRYQPIRLIADMVVIGGREYNTVKIGNQVWTVENLDYVWDGVLSEVGPDTDLRAVYYEYDEATWGWNGRRCGRLYNVPALRYLDDHPEMLPPGWRIPNTDDYTALFRYANIAGDSDSANTDKIRKGDLGWGSANWTGTNTTGFSWLPAGFFSPAGAGFKVAGSQAYNWTSTRHPDSSELRNALASTAAGAGVAMFASGDYYYASIRLVKDA